ncbi:APC family permease [Candidatus Woesearchaeota archaeon]|nr:APC family permease [Candidatus Woesearchaeota archaeon]
MSEPYSQDEMRKAFEESEEVLRNQARTTERMHGNWPSNGPPSRQEAESEKEKDMREARAEEKKDQAEAKAEADKDKKEGEAEEKKDRKESKFFSSIKTGAGAVKEGAATVVKSNIVFLGIFLLVCAMHVAKVIYGGGNIMYSFGIEVALLAMLGTTFGFGTFYVFLLSFFTPLIFVGIVNGAGVPGWLMFSLAFMIFFIITFKKHLMGIKSGATLAIIMIAGLYLIPRLTGISGNVFSGHVITSETPGGALLNVLANPMFHMWWVWYVGIVKNPGTGFFRWFIKVILIIFTVGMLLGGSTEPVKAGLKGFYMQSVTDEQKEQFQEALESGQELYSGVPLFETLYSIPSKIASAVNERIQAAAGPLYAASRPSDEDVKIVGLALKEAQFSEKYFIQGEPDDGGDENITLDVVIYQKAEVADEIRFVETRCRMSDKDDWTIPTDNDFPDEPVFTFFAPETYEFSCIPSCQGSAAYDEGEGPTCREGLIQQDCPADTSYAAGYIVCCPDPLPAEPCNIDGECNFLVENPVPSPGDCETGTYSPDVEATYKFATTSAFTAVFVDLGTKQQIGEDTLKSCGLDQYQNSVAEFNPPNSPAKLGITLTRSMPIGIGGNQDASSLRVIVTLENQHEGFVSGIKSLYVDLPNGLEMDTDSPRCDFNPPTGNRYNVKDNLIKEIYNADMLDYISFRCPLQDPIPDLLLGGAICAPKTISARADYYFTLEASIPSIRVISQQAAFR